MTPFSVSDVARRAGVTRPVVYHEIARGCLAARRGMTWTGRGQWAEAWLVEAGEAVRWAAAYGASRVLSGRPRDHELHRAAGMAPAAAPRKEDS